MSYILYAFFDLLINLSIVQNQSFKFFSQYMHFTMALWLYGKYQLRLPTLTII